MKSNYVVYCLEFSHILVYFSTFPHYPQIYTHFSKKSSFPALLSHISINILKIQSKYRGFILFITTIFLYVHIYNSYCITEKEVNFLNILTNVLLGRGSLVTNAIGYIDTGNTLKCRMTGRRVAVATYETAAAIAPPAYMPLIDDYMRCPQGIYHTDGFLPEGMYLIPYHTICSGNQMMLALDADYMFIDNTFIEKKPLIGISPGTFSVLRTKKCILLGKYYMKRGKRHVKHNQR